MDDRQREYILKGTKDVRGWFYRVDAEIVYLVTDYQNRNALDGAVVEIGLHHGKSFIALCLSLRQEQKAYGIDLFENQSLNRDRSGKGNRQLLERNLRSAGVNLSAVVLDARASTSVSPDDILGSVGAVRFFSIDGGHTIDVVRNDLSLAERTIAGHGVMALDDFLRPEWPDVSAGYFTWFAERSKPIVPFAIGFNKLYLCEQSHVARYQQILRSSEFLQLFLSKHYDFCGNELPVFQTFPQPDDWGWKKRVVEYLKLFHPDSYVHLKAARSRVRSRLLRH